MMRSDRFSSEKFDKDPIQSIIKYRKENLKLPENIKRNPLIAGDVHFLEMGPIFSLSIFDEICARTFFEVPSTRTRVQYVRNVQVRSGQSLSKKEKRQHLILFILDTTPLYGPQRNLAILRVPTQRHTNVFCYCVHTHRALRIYNQWQKE